jgi:DNA-binding MarR family transcriptional regulator
MADRRNGRAKLTENELETLRAVVDLEENPSAGQKRRGALAGDVAEETGATPDAERGRLARLEQRGYLKGRRGEVGHPTHWLSLDKGRKAAARGSV